MAHRNRQAKEPAMHKDPATAALDSVILIIGAVCGLFWVIALAYSIAIAGN
jgi:hypothetical protein